MSSTCKPTPGLQPTSMERDAGKRKMYSVIDNRANVQRRRKGLNNVFAADCGA